MARKSAYTPEAYARERARIKARQAEHPEKMREYNAAYRKRNKEMIAAKSHDWQVNNLHKLRAEGKLQRAVRSGKIKKPATCAVCDRTDVVGHHPDYSKWDYVYWLCRKHHAMLHELL